MKEYPHTSQEFKVNDKVHTMKKFTLGLQAKIEDENISVSYKEVMESCTSMNESEIMALDNDQLESIFVDIQAFTYTKKAEGDGEPKKP